MYCVYPFMKNQWGGGAIMTKLENYIKDIGMSKTDISIITEIDIGYISKLTSGKIKHPMKKTLKLLADAIDVSTEEIQQLIEEDGIQKQNFYLKEDIVKKKLAELKITQVSISRELGVHESTISHYIHGHISVSSDTLNVFTNILNCDKKEIIDISRSDFSKEKSELLSNNDIGNDDVIPNIEPVSTAVQDVKLPVTQICTKCMFENVVNIQINSNFSYPADTIQKWARRSICKMTDRDSVDYDPIMAEMISDMLFNYFINKKTPLRNDARYYVRQKKGRIHLKRDRGEIDSLRVYVISRTDKDGNHATRMTMTESEKDKVETILRDLNVNFVIRDIVDVLK